MRAIAGAGTAGAHDACRDHPAQGCRGVLGALNLRWLLCIVGRRCIGIRSRSCRSRVGSIGRTGLAVRWRGRCRRLCRCGALAVNRPRIRGAAAQPVELAHRGAACIACIARAPAERRSSASLAIKNESRRQRLRRGLAGARRSAVLFRAVLAVRRRSCIVRAGESDRICRCGGRRSHSGDGGIGGAGGSRLCRHGGVRVCRSVGIRPRLGRVRRTRRRGRLSVLMIGRIFGGRAGAPPLGPAHPVGRLCLGRDLTGYCGLVRLRCARTRDAMLCGWQHRSGRLSCGRRLGLVGVQKGSKRLRVGRIGGCGRLRAQRRECRGGTHVRPDTRRTRHCGAPHDGDGCIALATAGPGLAPQRS